MGRLTSTRMKTRSSIAGLIALSLFGIGARAEVKVTVERNRDGTPEFNFKSVPKPLQNDAAAAGKFTIVSGASDPDGGSVRELNDGRLPNEEDQPTRNFFFDAGQDGGRLQLDLGSVIEIKEVNSYSWHPAERGPQVYKLYGADGVAEGFNPAPKRGSSPEQCGWRFIAAVDTRPSAGEPGGQYGVSISDTAGALGRFRYFLFDISQTESRDEFGNTFYSEIDVKATHPAEPELAVGARPNGTAGSASADGPFVIRSTDQYCEISINTLEAPDLREWAEKKLAPALAEWYPKLVGMLPSEGYRAPTSFSVNIRPGNGVAATGGTRITANSKWLQGELNREAIGALIHEEVHVVQQYRGGRRNDPAYKRPPGWLVEGIPDYIRWFLYEPQSHGADFDYFSKRKNLKLKYDGLYRISANFLNFVIENYGQDNHVLAKVNAACREGKYTDELWQELTGKSLDQLDHEWQMAFLQQLIASR